MGRQYPSGQAYERYQAKEAPRFPADSPHCRLFGTMTLSCRFGTAALSHYRTVFDKAQATQFAAVCISRGDGGRYLFFRGTNNTIVGWQEDFCMSSEVVPAQREAVREETLKPDGKYRIGGHYKGGNLSIYSVLHCKEELRSVIPAVLITTDRG